MRSRNTLNTTGDYARDKRDPQNLRRAGEKNWWRFEGKHASIT
jgi:hypothetical protein